MKKLIFGLVFLLILGSAFASAGWVDNLKIRLGISDASLSPGCYDSDGGKDLLVKGYVMTANTDRRWDACVNDATVLERYCTSINTLAYETLSCPSGKTCIDGACVTQSIPSCSSLGGQVCTGGTVCSIQAVASTNGICCPSPGSCVTTTETRDVRVGLKNASSGNLVAGVIVKIIKGTSGDNVAFTKNTGSNGYTDYFQFTVGQTYSAVVSKNGFESRTIILGQTQSGDPKTYTYTINPTPVPSAPSSGGGSAPSCSSECTGAGYFECASGTTYRVCGNYDSDSCFEWGSPVSCGAGQTCVGAGQCVSPSSGGSGSGGTSSGGSSSSVCYDSDTPNGGTYNSQSIYSAGTVTYGTSIYHDECYSSVRVREWYCSNIQTPQPVTIHCGSGYECKMNSNSEAYCSLISTGSDSNDDSSSDSGDSSGTDTSADSTQTPSQPTPTEFPNCGASNNDQSAVEPVLTDGKMRRIVKSTSANLVCASGSAACQAVGMRCYDMEYYDTVSGEFKTSDRVCGESVAGYASDGYIYAAVCTSNQGSSSSGGSGGSVQQTPDSNYPNCGVSSNVFNPGLGEGISALHLGGADGAAACTSGSSACATQGLGCSGIIYYDGGDWVRDENYGCDTAASGYSVDLRLYAAECSASASGGTSDNPPANTEEGWANIKLRIVDRQTGEAISGAEVYFSTKEGGGSGMEYTNSQGYVTHRVPVPAGGIRYYVEVRADGYQTLSEQSLNYVYATAGVSDKGTYRLTSNTQAKTAGGSGASFFCRVFGWWC